MGINFHRKNKEKSEKARIRLERELVFIPVNNPNFHWSLIVYEIKEKKFWHWDTLGGDNWGYVEGLVTELAEQLWEKNFSNLKDYLMKRHGIKQGNGWVCGVEVIGIVRRIGERYQNDLNNIKLGELDFVKERKNLRERYLEEVSSE